MVCRACVRRRVGRYYQDQEGGIQGFVWKACCYGCTMSVLLQEVLWDACHSLRARWWGYDILIVLVGGKMVRTEVEYIDFGDAIEKWSTWGFWKGGAEGIWGHGVCVPGMFGGGESGKSLGL